MHRLARPSNHRIITAGAIATASLLAAMAAADAGEWPQILGPSRNGVAAADERLAPVWPAEGPRVVWRRPVGSGCAGVAVTEGRVILFHRVDDREVVEALDAATGESLWSDGHPTSFRPQVGGGDGPLCTPVVQDGRVIAFGPQGILACVDLKTGRRLWQRDTHREFGAQEGYFGAGSTPLVIGDRVIVNVGGSRQDAGIVAFAAGTGETLWQATAEPASYSAPVAAAVADLGDGKGLPQALVVSRYRCQLVDPTDGTNRWQIPFGMRGPTVNAATPLVIEDRLLLTASYGIGSICARFDRAGTTVLWEGSESLATQYCTPIAIDGHLYAIDGRDDIPPADLKCIDLATGRVAWIERDFGYGTLLAADGKLLATKTDGELLLLEASPRGVKVLSRCRPLDGGIRALPALAAGRLYLRDDRSLVCLDLSR